MYFIEARKFQAEVAYELLLLVILKTTISSDRSDIANEKNFRTQYNLVE